MPDPDTDADHIDPVDVDAIAAAEERLVARCNRASQMLSALAPLGLPAYEGLDTRDESRKIYEVIAWIAKSYRRDERHLDRLRREAGIL
jgi:hypothetical protein